MNRSISIFMSIVFAVVLVVMAVQIYKEHEILWTNSNDPELRIGYAFNGVEYNSNGTVEESIEFDFEEAERGMVMFVNRMGSLTSGSSITNKPGDPFTGQNVINDCDQYDLDGYTYFDPDMASSYLCQVICQLSELEGADEILKNNNLEVVK